jgi:hypothetical protein
MSSLVMPHASVTGYSRALPWHWQNIVLYGLLAPPFRLNSWSVEYDANEGSSSEEFVSAYVAKTWATVYTNVRTVFSVLFP